ncbi:catalase-like domain-containing protein [Neohortaea acidophila]|uniref:Catalase-like domain-containing protein n=1 Tax=Neohortaea acidophila TaxID=245834 RepID=A0A6A6PKF2_9PEZI|nr:catalase-like domain-containing protein [Neohortaea acidophila]KAF2479747.1 catalase-like domain-containing protein [Neohortaea acidophila]
MGSAPIKWNDKGVEPEVPNEQQKIEQMHNLINKVQEHNFSQHRHGFRGTHVKTQAIVKGQLQVASNLSPELAQGLFGKGGKTFPIAIRYANEPSWLQDDRAGAPRGCGMKVFNVDDAGAFLDPTGEETHTQDFTFNNAPILELTDLPTTVEIFTLREKYFKENDWETLRAKLKERKDSELQFAPTQLPNNHFMGYTMYSQSAYRFGDYVVKYALFPTGKFQQELGEKAAVNDNSDPEQHSLWLREYFQANDAEFDFRVQLCRNLEQQSVEDCSQQWDEEKYPFETVGKVVLPKGQDVFDSKRRAFWDEQMKLNVWYGLEAHRPLGSANRLRKTLYQASLKKREELNATKVRAVKSIEEIP